MIRYFFGAALAALTLSATVASAQPAPQPQDVMVVRLSDLDTGHAAGAQAALRRIRSAANRFCGEDGSRDLGRHFEQQRCADRMVTKAVDALGSTQVAQLWTTKGAIRGVDTNTAITLASAGQ
jgi:UrcA family protein